MIALVGGWEVWEVLKPYGVHQRVMKLLEDLHTGKQAVAQEDGDGLWREWLMLCDPF